MTDFLTISIDCTGHPRAASWADEAPKVNRHGYLSYGQLEAMTRGVKPVIRVSAAVLGGGLAQ